MSISIFRSYKPLTVLAGTAATALLIGWVVGIGAQAADPETPGPAPAQQQAAPPANEAAATLPPLPLGHDDVREVQNQLIALGFDPGTADGQIGPATNAAAQQYDQSRGGTGRVSIDSALLARLKADTAPRLTYEQVAERSRAHQQTASAPGAAQFGSIVQQFAPLIGAAIASSNNNGYYGPPTVYYGPGPGYYTPPPVYYGYGY
jgi:hypothetical protein